jgi:hypothetical protein
MFIEERIRTEVTEKYDVIVCGGGFAGISAALAAARQGKRTLLLEKQFILGGLGTAGIVTIYLPLCDGFGHQVSFGIAEELLRLSIKHGYEAKYPDNWLTENGSRGEHDKRFEVQYNPHLFAITVEQLLLDAGVEILYGASVVAVTKKEDRIEHVIIETKSGRTAYAVGSVVDATGDCDVAVQAGMQTEVFQQGNVLAAWYYSLGEDGYNLHMLGCSDTPEEEKKKNGKDVRTLSNRRFGGIDGKELSEQVCMSHLSLYYDFLKRREKDPTLIPVTMPTIPQVRMTRKIVGEYTLCDNELHTYFEDSIGMVSNWKRRGPIYEVPFRTLYHRSVKNLICAGRCTSVNETLWDVMRVIPCCAVTGQAAGVAAAMSNDFTTLDVGALQAELQNGGVVLHEREIL